MFIFTIIQCSDIFRLLEERMNMIKIKNDNCAFLRDKLKHVWLIWTKEIEDLILNEKDDKYPQVDTKSKGSRCMDHLQFQQTYMF